MVQIGDYNVMNVVGTQKEFFVLELDGTRALLPRKGAERCTIGGSAKVFVFNNGPNDIRATFGKPYAVINETANLRAKDAARFGVFFDWGIEKDLFVPSRFCPDDVRPGLHYFVRVIADPDGNGVMGDCRYREYIQKEAPDMQPGEPVHLLIYEKTKLGYNALINNSYTGLIYHSEVFRDVNVGDSCTGYIKQVREDGAVDLSLQRQGQGGMLDAADTITAALREHGGFLPLHDKSDAGEIYRILGLSKKAFKRGAGTLYKQRLIAIEENGIRLL